MFYPAVLSKQGVGVRMESVRYFITKKFVVGLTDAY